MLPILQAEKSKLRLRKGWCFPACTWRWAVQVRSPCLPSLLMQPSECSVQTDHSFRETYLYIYRLLKHMCVTWFMVMEENRIVGY